MKKLIIITYCFLYLTIVVKPVQATSPFPLLMGTDIGTNVSEQKFLEDVVSANPMYIFSNPYYEVSKLTKSRIQDIHSHLPQTKVILHIFCCNLFNQEKLQTSGSPIAKVAFSSQNTQTEFLDMWNNHRVAFMKDISGEYVYNIIPHTTQMWLDAGQSYLMDMENPHFQNLLYKKIREHVLNGGFDGIYLDLMMPGFPTTHYSSNPVIDGVPMTYTQGKNKLISLSRALQEKRKNDPNPTMRNAYIFTNSVGGGKGQFYSNEELIQYNIDLQTQGVQIENPFHDFPNITTNQWLETVALFKSITGLRNNTMRGWINFHHSDGVSSMEICNQQSLFTYASYLLANQSPNFAFMFLCKIKDSSLPDRRIFASDTLVKIPLGSAIDQYQKLASGLYIREFANGFALVNPTDQSHNYKPTVNLKNAYSSLTYSKNVSFTIPAKTGLVLLKDSSRPGDFNSDGKVNLLDYNLLVSGYGTSYNLTHYNLLVAHFGE